MSAPVSMTTREHLAWLTQYWRPHRTFAAVLVFWTVLSSAVAVAFPLVWKLVIEGLEELPPGSTLAPDDLTRYGLILAAIAVGRVIVGLYPAFRACSRRSSRRTTRSLAASAPAISSRG
jgi:ABC-type multidrug transport system fused ATPase/permease subunit